MHQLVHVVSEGVTSKRTSHDGVGERVTFIDGDGMTYTLTGIKDDSIGSAGGVDGEDCLLAHIEGGDVEGFEHDLGHLLSILHWVERGFGEENRVFFRGDFEFFIETVMPYLFHIIP